jgi:hypothetical protein
MRTIRIPMFLAVALAVVAGSPAGAESQASRVLVSVVDRAGASVRDLTAGDFLVKVNDRDATILDAAPLAEPLSVVVVPEGFSQNIISDARKTLRGVVTALRRHNPDSRVGLMLGEGASTPRMYEVGRQGGDLERQIGRYFESPTSSPIMDSILVATQTLSAERHRTRVILVVSVGGVFQDSLPATRVAKAIYESGASFWAMDGVRSRPIGASSARVLAEISKASGGRHESSSLASLAANTEHMVNYIVSRYGISFEAAGFRDSAWVAVRRPGLSVTAPVWPAELIGR